MRWPRVASLVVVALIGACGRPDREVGSTSSETIRIGFLVKQPQKVVLGRWLAGRLEVMLLDEPTRGVDIGAKSEIYALVYALARKGVGVVVSSSELPELLGVCDRLLVLRQGRIVASLTRAEATPAAALALALPASAQEAAS
ncbi:MAG TPA: hypothetical protein VKA01_13105 [Vicinamibacteria bacterium]|nr:hypothetical protein [Vicinamibacteria bacterium]